MKISGGVAAFAGALVLLCGVVAWEWYSHIGGSNAAPQPVQQVAASAAPSKLSPSPSSSPVVYVPQAQPSVSPIATAAATSAPSAHASASPSAAPAATPEPYRTTGSVVRDEPMVAATLAPHVVAARAIAEPPDAPPRILSFALSTPVAHGGEVVSGLVETSSNVASVEARIGGYSSAMQKVGVGKFALSYRVPKLPFFLHRTYSIEIIARNTHGDAVHSSVPITIR
jgi:hypothetical protein